MFRTSAIKLKRTLGNNNAQHIDSHVDLPSKVKVHQTKSSLEDPAALVAWVGMVHYISTLPGVADGLGWESVAFVCIHVPILSISAS